MVRRLPALAGQALLVAAAVLGGSRAAAQDSTNACVDAHVAAQRLRRDGKLRAAREQLVSCARTSCPQVLVRECAGWLSEVEATIPSVVFEATDETGRDLVDVRVEVDGQLLLARLGGSAVEMDPGEHQVRWTHPERKPVEQAVVVREGDRGRRISARLEPLVAPSAGGGAVVAAAEERPVPVATWVLAGVGVAGIGAFGVLGGIGLSKEGDLDARRCAPNCPSEDVDSVRTTFLIGDIALGVGVAALAGATVFYLTRPAVPASAARPSPVRFGFAWQHGPRATLGGAL
jgi:hypothetical protein